MSTGLLGFDTKVPVYACLMRRCFFEKRTHKKYPHTRKLRCLFGWGHMEGPVAKQTIGERSKKHVMQFARTF